MKYYKIMKDTAYIGAVSSNDFVAQNPVNGWLLTSNEIHGQFVVYNNELYRDYWMQPIPNNQRPYIIAELSEISAEEYDALKVAEINNIEVVIEDEPEEEPIPEIIEDNEPDYVLEFVRESKLKEMSTACRTTIEGGFDLELRNEIHHFSLDTQDQLNLISLSAMAQTQSLIPYHADGEACIFYTNEEMNEIVETATSFKIYHTTYYNALKAYINSLETIESLAAIYYGIEIPEEFKSDVLRALEV